MRINLRKVSNKLNETGFSGRGYVYQAMRVTGAADPTAPVEETMKGKLSQKKLVRGAASGYSSYGNQIGLATGLVKTSQHLDEDEFIDVEKYTLDELKDMIFAGTIQDSKTISAVLAYDALLNRKKNN